MEHHGAMLVPVFADIFGVEAIGQHIVELDRADRPFAADGVLDDEVELGRIEGAVTLRDHRLDARRAGGGHHLRFGLVPELIRTGALFGARGEIDVIRLQPEVGVDGFRQRDEARRFRLDLVLSAEDVRIVLREGADAHQAMQRARGFIAVARAELGHAHGQVAIGFLALLEDLDVAGAVHRLQRQRLVFRRLRDEHVVAILVPVARLFPELAVEHLRSAHFDIVGFIEAAAHIVLDHAPERQALGVPEHHALALFLHVEEIEFATELAVIALLGFLDAHEVGGEILLVHPCRAVHPLQHLVAMIAAPVGSGQLHQLERLRQLARGGQVRAAAEVAPLVAMRIERDGLAGRNDIVDDLRFVILADLPEVRDGVVLAPDFAIDGEVAIHDLLHLRFDLREVLRRERLLAREVVIEPVLDRRPDRHLRAGEKFLHGLCEDVGGIVADEVERFLRVDIQQLQRHVAVERAFHVVELAIHLRDHRPLGQRLGDCLRDRQRRRPIRVFALRAIGEGYVDHGRVFRRAGGGVGRFRVPLNPP